MHLIHLHINHGVAGISIVQAQVAGVFLICESLPVMCGLYRRIKSQCWRVIHLHQWGNTLWGHLRCHLLPHDFEAYALGLLPLVPWMDGNVSPHTCPPAPITHWMGEVDRFLGQLNLPFKFRSLISVYSGTSRDSGCRLWLEMNIFQAVLRGFESQQCKTLPNRIF